MGRAFEVRKAAMAKTSAAKAKVYAKFGKEIYIAAKAGTPDPDMNLTLKRMIERAKANQVPTDVINRAIDKAKGGSSEQYEYFRYEGFGNSDSSIIIECLSDNVNRTYSEVRAAFNKAKAKLGVAGSVSFNYENLAILSFPGNDEEGILDALILAEVDVKDLEVEDDFMSVYAPPSDLYKAKEAIETRYPGVEFSILEISWLPNEKVKLEGEDLELFNRLITLLEDVDDVQDIYHNVEM